MLGVPLTQATIGHPKDLSKALGLASHFAYASCNCLLMPGPLGECMVKEAAKVAVPSHLVDLREGQVVVLAKPSEFVSVFNKVRSGQGAGGPPKPPTIVLPPSGKPKGSIPQCKSPTACDPAGKVKVSTNGETKFAVGCEEGIETEFSTSGAVDLKLGSGPLKMVVPVKSSQ